MDEHISQSLNFPYISTGSDDFRLITDEYKSIFSTSFLSTKYLKDIFSFQYKISTKLMIKSGILCTGLLCLPLRMSVFP